MFYITVSLLEYKIRNHTTFDNTNHNIIGHQMKKNELKTRKHPPFYKGDVSLKKGKRLHYIQ
jgi:hypothetical protein